MSSSCSKRTYSECLVDEKAIKRDNVHPYIDFCMDCVARDNCTKAYDLESLLHLYFQVSTNDFFPKVNWKKFSTVCT